MNNTITNQNFNEVINIFNLIREIGYDFSEYPNDDARNYHNYETKEHLVLNDRYSLAIRNESIIMTSNKYLTDTHGDICYSEKELTFPMEGNFVMILSLNDDADDNLIDIFVNDLNEISFKYEYTLQIISRDDYSMELLFNKIK